MAGLTSIASTFFDQLSTGSTVRDYQHGARTFVDGLYRLGPKFSSLFHVYIDINPEIAIPTSLDMIELGMMAKSVTLPKFNIQHKVYNAYNRKNIAQERITYDPVTITFHDDGANIVNNFWKNIYQTYYADSKFNDFTYNKDHKYSERANTDWGYSPTTDAVNYNLISKIRIYSLHQQQYTLYTLINPTITSFQHGTHTAGEYALMEHSMTVTYETVQYSGVNMQNGMTPDERIPMGFAKEHYDRGPSPLSSLGGGTKSIIGPGGLMEGVNDALGNMASGNYGAAIVGALRTAKNAKNMDLKSVALAEVTQLGKNVLNGSNPQSRVFIPDASSITTGIAKSVGQVAGSATKVISQGASGLLSSAKKYGNVNSQQNQNSIMNGGSHE